MLGGNRPVLSLIMPWSQAAQVSQGLFRDLLNSQEKVTP